jgi:23S rRNA pseudouridine955/2504/2580 synthase
MSLFSDKTAPKGVQANNGGVSGKTPARFVTIDAEMAERRLDNFLMAELKGLPRSHIYKMIRSGEVRVNKGRIKPARRLLEGDIVRIPPVQLATEVAKQPLQNPDWINKYIIYKDDDVIALNKPSGLAVHGGSGISAGLIELMRAANPQERSLELVHRLDRATSGCILVARKRSSLRYLHEAFREGGVKKSYLTLLDGRLSSGTQDVRLALEVHTREGGERHVSVSEKGKPAHTRFIPLSVYSEATYCKVDLFTGRTHQIRVHAEAIGHPVLGDARYGNPESNALRKLKLKRLFLHAAVLEYPERNGHGTVMIQAPMGEELNAALNRLDKM